MEKVKRWVSIEHAYGEYTIKHHNTKKEAVNYITCGLCDDEHKTNKLGYGSYEIETPNSTHIVCRTFKAEYMGYKI